MIKPGRKIRVLPCLGLRKSASSVFERVRLHKVLFATLIFLLPCQLGKHFWPDWSYVLGLRIDYLAPTIYLTDLLVLGILLAWIWKRQKLSATRLAGRQVSYQLSAIKKYWWIIAFFFFLFINAFLAQNQGVAFYKLLRVIEFSLLSFYVAKNKNPLSIIHYPLSISVIYSSLIALVQFFKQSSLGGLFWWLGERSFTAGTPGIAKAIVSGRLVMRPYATFSHPNVLAGFTLVSLIFVGIAEPIFKRGTRGTSEVARRDSSEVERNTLGMGEVLKWLTMILGIVTILISFSRAAWLVGLAVGLWLALKTPPMVVRQLAGLLGGGEKRKKFFLITFLAFFFVLCSLFFVLKLPFSTEEAVSQRLQLIKASLSMMREYPLIGVGLNNFIVRLPDFWQSLETVRFLQPVHNLFLLVAAETGLVGLLVFLWFLFLTYKRLLDCYFAKLLKKKGKYLQDLPITHYSLLITLSAILVLGFFDHYWLTLQQTQLLLAIVLGLSWGNGAFKKFKSPRV